MEFVRPYRCTATVAPPDVCGSRLLEGGIAVIMRELHQALEESRMRSDAIERYSLPSIVMPEVFGKRMLLAFFEFDVTAPFRAASRCWFVP